VPRTPPREDHPHLTPQSQPPFLCLTKRPYMASTTFRLRHNDQYNDVSTLRPGVIAFPVVKAESQRDTSSFRDRPCNRYAGSHFATLAVCPPRPEQKSNNNMYPFLQSQPTRASDIPGSRAPLLQTRLGEVPRIHRAGTADRHKVMPFLDTVASGVWGFKRSKRGATHAHLGVGAEKQTCSKTV
jgi:hypothetical protein